MTDPRGELPRGSVRIITVGARGRFLLVLLLLAGGAIALVLGTTLLITLLAAGVVVAAVGAVVMGVRRLVGRGNVPDTERRVPRRDLDPSMEVFPDPSRPVRGALEEGEDADKRSDT